MNEKKGGITIKGKVKQRIRWRIRESWTEREERDYLLFHLNLRTSCGVGLGREDWIPLCGTFRETKSNE